MCGGGGNPVETIIQPIIDIGRGKRPVNPIQDIVNKPKDPPNLDPNDPDSPVYVKPPEIPAKAYGKAAQDAELARKRGRRRSTILTGVRGIEDDAPVRRRTVLGA